jgi:hypothetical protein
LAISWREVLALLVGLALCYTVFSYALTMVSENREAASEQPEEKETPLLGSSTQQSATTTPEGEAMKTLTIRVKGPEGETFGINYGNVSSGRSVEGVFPADYEVQVNTDPRSWDYAWALAWKTTGDDEELRVQILDNGKVIRQWATTEDYGSAYVRWYPNEKESPSEETTAPSKGKALKDNEPKS